MGQIKNIKLHIVTDIKVYVNMVKSELNESPESASLCALKRKCTPLTDNINIIEAKKTKSLECVVEKTDATIIVAGKEGGKDVVDGKTFQKDFYNMHTDTAERSAQTVDEYYTQHNIKLKGKGKKLFKPLLNFLELGFLKKYMVAC